MDERVYDSSLHRMDRKIGREMSVKMKEKEPRTE